MLCNRDNMALLQSVGVGIEWKFMPIVLKCVPAILLVGALSRSRWVTWAHPELDFLRIRSAVHKTAT